jgi:hypothetical protein
MIMQATPSLTRALASAVLDGRCVVACLGCIVYQLLVHNHVGIREVRGKSSASVPIWDAFMCRPVRT